MVLNGIGDGLAVDLDVDEGPWQVWIGIWVSAKGLDRDRDWGLDFDNGLDCG